MAPNTSARVTGSVIKHPEVRLVRKERCADDGRGDGGDEHGHADQERLVAEKGRAVRLRARRHGERSILGHEEAEHDNQGEGQEPGQRAEHGAQQTFDAAFGEKRQIEEALEEVAGQAVGGLVLHADRITSRICRATGMKSS